MTTNTSRTEDVLTKLEQDIENIVDLAETYVRSDCTATQDRGMGMYQAVAKIRFYIQGIRRAEAAMKG